MKKLKNKDVWTDEKDKYFLSVIVVVLATVALLKRKHKRYTEVSNCSPWWEYDLYTEGEPIPVRGDRR